MLPLPRSHNRFGFTMIELIMVVVFVAAIFAIAVPRMTTVRDSSALRSARQQLASAFSTARSVALQKGQDADLLISGSRLTVRVRSGLASTRVTVFGPVDLEESAGVVVAPISGSPDSLTFSGRGLLKTTVAGTMVRYELRYDSKRDTLCVSNTGIILPRGCQP